MSYVVGIIGYIIMMATFMGFYLFFGVKPHVWMDIGLLMMFYALYYGVMARDVAEICTEKMVSGNVSHFQVLTTFFSSIFFFKTCTRPRDLL